MARPQPQNLPGIETGIPELEELGFEYAALRDRRMKVLAEEVELKRKVIPLMQKHKLNEYTTEGITMKLVPGELKLKVTVDKSDDDDPDDAE